VEAFACADVSMRSHVLSHKASSAFLSMHVSVQFMGFSSAYACSPAPATPGAAVLNRKNKTWLSKTKQVAAGFVFSAGPALFRMSSQCSVVLLQEGMVIQS